MAHNSIFTSRFFAATNPSAANDRGTVHQLLVGLGVSSNTAHTIQVWTIAPLRILLIILVAWIATRIERRYALRIVRSLRAAPPMLQPSARTRARGTTIAGVISAVIRAVIWVIAALAIMSELGINLGAFVAGATILGAALGFGAQTLVKDFLSGILILAEDEYGIGDSIVVNDTTGTVEGMTLRVTRIRSIDGVVWYVPNGDIRTVGNNSEGDSVALVEVLVPLGTDLVAAGRVIEEEARRLAAEPAWSSVIVGDASFAGIADVTKDGATLRVMVRTIPGEHMRTSRELRLRFLERIRRDELAWMPLPVPTGAPAIPVAASPRTVVSSPEGGSSPASPAQPDPPDKPAASGPPSSRASTHPPRWWRFPGSGGTPQ